jgi:hypothetical protein
MRNLLTCVPESTRSFVATTVRTIIARLDAETMPEQHRRVANHFATRSPSHRPRNQAKLRLRRDGGLRLR